MRSSLIRTAKRTRKHPLSLHRHVNALEASFDNHVTLLEGIVAGLLSPLVETPESKILYARRIFSS